VQGPQAARATSVDTGNVYERVRQEIVTTVSALSDDELRVRVPATPAWSVRDVLAHVVGLATDLNAQRFPSASDPAGTAWTARQVERSQGRAVHEVLAEWDREAPSFEAGLRAFGYELGSHFVADGHAHYQDIRGALGLSSDRDELTVRVALDHYLGFFEEMLTDARWGTLDVVAGIEMRRLGTRGPHHARVRAEPFELLRTLSSRRSAHQIRELDWHGDLEGLLSLLRSALSGNYSLRDTDLIE
jgi:hypothetical protein